MGLDGNLYFTSNNPNRLLTVGKVDAKTGEVKYLKVDGPGGRAATAHGLVRDGEGNFWFDVNPGRRSLGKLDVKTDKITVYQTPNNMSPLGGAVTMDVDGKGKIWASAPDGVLRFDPATETFTDFKSKTPFKNAQGHQQHLRGRRRPRRQRLVGADGVRHHRQGRHDDRQDVGSRAAACSRTRWTG